MFNNIGKKIKTLAVILCVLGMIASLVVAYCFWFYNSSMNNFFNIANIIHYGSSAYNIGRNNLIGFGVLIVGSLLSWIGSFFIYGFGQLIEKTEENNQHLHNIGYLLSDIKNHK